MLQVTVKLTIAESALRPGPGWRATERRPLLGDGVLMQFGNPQYDTRVLREMRPESRRDRA